MEIASSTPVAQRLMLRANVAIDEAGSSGIVANLPGGSNADCFDVK